MDPKCPGGPPGSPDEDGDRFVEFWNLVFPQFDRSPDGTLTPLPKPGVDTGMGLERVAAITQGVHSNYEIDLFKNLIAAVGEIAGIGRNDQLPNPSVRVIADHIRSSAFLIADGVTPSNEDRGYVLAPDHPTRAAPWSQARHQRRVLSSARRTPRERNG